MIYVCLKRVATIEVENEQLQFMKSIQQYDADKTPENPKSTAESQPETPLDLGFPDEEDPNNDGIQSHHRPPT